MEKVLEKSAINPYHLMVDQLTEAKKQTKQKNVSKESFLLSIS